MIFVILLAISETELQFLNMLSDLVNSLPSTKIGVVLEKMKPLLKDGIIVPRSFETFIYGFSCFQYMRKCFQCANCRSWNRFNNVFCEHCSHDLSLRQDLSKVNYRLFNCVNKGCVGHRESTFLSEEEARHAHCHHLTKRATHKRVSFLTTNEICGEYIRNGLVDDCALLTEEELLAILPIAKYWETYCSLFSENAQLIYEKTGFTRAAKLIKELHVYDKRTSIEVIQLYIPILREQANYHQSHYISMSYLHILLVLERLQFIQVQDVSETNEAGTRRTSRNTCHPLFEELDQNHFSCFYANVENAEERLSDSRRAKQSRARRNTSRGEGVNNQGNSTESTYSQTTEIPSTTTESSLPAPSLETPDALTPPSTTTEFSLPTSTTTDPVVVAAAVENGVVGEKRKRGRPRKIPNTSSTVTTTFTSVDRNREKRRRTDDDDDYNEYVNNNINPTEFNVVGELAKCNSLHIAELWKKLPSGMVVARRSFFILLICR